MTRVVEVQPLEGARLRVRFSEGVKGVSAVEPERRGGVFVRLADPLSVQPGDDRRRLWVRGMAA